MPNETTIGISRKNRDRLASFGKATDTFDSALDNILALAEECRREVKAMEEEERQNVLELASYSDECLKGNFGFGKQKIAEIRATAKRIRQLS